jgi:hypothetical protein
MRYLIKVLCAVLLSAFGLSGLQAQTMYVKENSGTQTAYALSGIRKITFSTGNLTVHETNNNTWVYVLSGLSYLSFQNYVTGLEEQIQPGNATVFTYPNPVTDVLSIDLTGAGNLTGSISILTIEGKVLQEQMINSAGLVKIDLSELPQGIYLCRYVGTTDIKTVKIIKQ